MMPMLEHEAMRDSEEDVVGERTCETDGGHREGMIVEESGVSSWDHH